MTRSVKERVLLISFAIVILAAAAGWLWFLIWFGLRVLQWATT